MWSSEKKVLEWLSNQVETPTKRNPFRSTPAPSSKVLNAKVSPSSSTTSSTSSLSNCVNISSNNITLESTSSSSCTLQKTLLSNFSSDKSNTESTSSSNIIVINRVNSPRESLADGNKLQPILTNSRRNLSAKKSTPPSKKIVTSTARYSLSLPSMPSNPIAPVKNAVIQEASLGSQRNLSAKKSTSPSKKIVTSTARNSLSLPNMPPNPIAPVQNAVIQEASLVSQRNLSAKKSTPPSKKIVTSTARYSLTLPNMLPNPRAPVKNVINQEASSCSSLAKRARLSVEEHSTSQMNEELCLSERLQAHTKKQLIDIIEMQMSDDEKEQEHFLVTLPQPDYKALIQELQHIGQNVVESLPKPCKFNRFAYLCASVHLTEFNNLLKLQLKQLYASGHWYVLSEYIFDAWPCVASLPIWINANHNLIALNCYKVLARYCIAIIRYANENLHTDLISKIQNLLVEWSEDPATLMSDIIDDLNIDLKCNEM